MSAVFAKNNSDIETLKSELNGPKSQHKAVVKKIINLMNSGINLSAIFADVIKISQTDDLKLKKMIYIYLMEYSVKNNDLAILTVNTIIKDFSSRNPIIRSIATRAVGQMDFELYGKYLFEPVLKKALSDRDPYVSKFAVNVVAKIYFKDPDILTSNSLKEPFLWCLYSGNPAVVSNTISSLNEMMSMGGKDIFPIEFDLVSKLLILLNDCNFWAKDSLLEFLFNYETTDENESCHIIDSMLKQASDNHLNVVFGSVKVILKFEKNVVNDENYRENAIRTCTQAILTLLYCGSVYMFAILKNVQILNEIYPGLFVPFISSFLAKHTDEIYIRIEKLKVLTQLATEGNLKYILEEIKEVEKEMNEKLLNCALDCIEKLAYKFPSHFKILIFIINKFMEKNIDSVNCKIFEIFQRLIESDSDASKLIFGIVSNYNNEKSSDNLKANILLFLSQNPAKVENVSEILASISSNFETSGNKFQLAAIKFAYLVNKSKICVLDSQECLKYIFEQCMKPKCDVYVREQAIMYWRLLNNSLNVDFGKNNDKSRIVEHKLEDLEHLMQVSALYGQNADTFCKSSHSGKKMVLVSSDGAESKSLEKPVSKPEDFNDLIEFD